MIKTQITVINKLGLHARASSKLAQLAASFSSTIKIGKTVESLVDCKSIMALMLLAAGIGTELVMQVEGEDEQLATQKITELFSDYFGEGE